MPVGVANRHEFVKCKNDADLRQDTARERQQINAKQMKMVEVNDIRLDELEKFCE